MRPIDADALKDALGIWREWENALYVERIIDEAPTIGGWISVEDRLPVRPPDVCGLLVRRQWYLVALESGTVLTLSYEFDEGRWQGVGSPVTHWMPLPDPPTDG